MKRRGHSICECNPMKPTVCLIPTGGTISDRSTEAGAAPMAKSAQNLLSQLEDLGVRLRVREGLIEKGSAHIVPDDWKKMAEATAAALQSGADGVVILHGTDIMHYTAAALSFMVQNLNRPVVMTGSMIPGADRGSDSLFNLQNAITVAAFGDLAEVCIAFSADPQPKKGVIIRGGRARKIHSTAINAFGSINIPPLGFIENGKITYTGVNTRKRGTGELQLFSKLDPHVILVKQNPALTAPMLGRFLEGASGAVIEGTGAGHIRSELIEALASFNGPVVMSTQAIYGGVKWGLYASDKSYMETKNFISAGDMTSETALVKLMWALGQGGDIRQTMLTNIAGELMESL